jgi:hypothetical protein
MNIAITAVRDESEETLREFVERIPSGIRVVAIVNGEPNELNRAAERILSEAGATVLTHYAPIADANPLRTLRYTAFKASGAAVGDVVGFLDADCYYDPDVLAAFDTVRRTGRLGILDNNYLTTPEANQKLKDREAELWQAFKDAGSRYWFAKLRAVQILCPAEYISEAFAAEMDPGPAFMTTLINTRPGVQPGWMGERVNISFRESGRVKFGMRPDVICASSPDMPWDPITGVERLRYMIDNGLVADNFYAHRDVLLYPWKVDDIVRAHVDSQRRGSTGYLVRTDNPALHKETWVCRVGDMDKVAFFPAATPRERLKGVLRSCDRLVSVGPGTLPLVDNLDAAAFDRRSGIEDALTVIPAGVGTFDQPMQSLSTAELSVEVMSPEVRRRHLAANRKTLLGCCGIASEAEFRRLYAEAYREKQPRAYWVWLSESPELPFQLLASVTSFIRHNAWARPSVAVSTKPSGRRAEQLAALGVEFILVPEIDGLSARIPNVRHRADLVRFDLLHSTGGMYFDTDTITIGSLHDLWRSSGKAITLSSAGQRFELSIGCMICPEPGNAYLDMVLRGFSGDVPPGDNGKSIVEPTAAYAKIMATASRTDGDQAIAHAVRVVDHSYFYPYFWDFAREVTERGTVVPSLFRNTVQVHLYGGISGKTLDKVDETNWMFERNVLADAYRLAMLGSPGIVTERGV